MEIVKEYILQNWILVLILIAFVIFLITTSFLDKKASKRLYFLLAEVFVLSITVFLEFYYEDDSYHVYQECEDIDNFNFTGHPEKQMFKNDSLIQNYYRYVLTAKGE